VWPEGAEECATGARYCGVGGGSLNLVSCTAQWSVTGIRMRNADLRHWEVGCKSLNIVHQDAGWAMVTGSAYMMEWPHKVVLRKQVLGECFMLEVRALRLGGA
jgi:hypothetical protein